MIFSDSFCKEVKSMWVQKGIEMDESAYLLHTMLKILTAILWFTNKDEHNSYWYQGWVSKRFDNCLNCPIEK